MVFDDWVVKSLTEDAPSRTLYEVRTLAVILTVVHNALTTVI